MSGENPFIKKEYYVNESPLWANCDVAVRKTPNSSNVSTISKVAVSGVAPMNILELENYLSLQIIHFLKVIKLAQVCDSYAIQGLSVPPECSKTFTTSFSSSGYQQKLKNNASAADLKQFPYTASYISSKSSNNEKKQLCQRLEDIKSLLEDFNDILNKIPQGDVSTYTDKLNYLQDTKMKNQQLRDLLDKKLDQIYSTDTRHTDSLVMLDSTVYTSVLWTILATSIIYFMFKKM